MSRPSPAAARRLAELLDRLALAAPPADGRSTRRALQPSVSGAAAPAGLLPLYAAARRRTGSPLADGAAGALLRALRGGGSVLITTGLVTPHIPAGETDGPPGAAVLARAVALGCRVAVHLLTEAPVVPVLAAALNGLARGEAAGGQWRDRVSLEVFPVERAAARARARALWGTLQPAAVIAVEKLGPNGAGVVHTMRGEDVTGAQARAEVLFVAARRRGVLTVGVGDRGNELGMGRLLPGAGPCGCDCGGSIACSVPADRPVVSLNSNWGSYAIAAALAARTGRPQLLHAPAAEARMLRAIVRAGARDGVTGRPAATVDAAPLALQTAFVGALRALVARARRS